jgi:hypothetical protein
MRACLRAGCSDCRRLCELPFYRGFGRIQAWIRGWVSWHLNTELSHRVYPQKRSRLRQLVVDRSGESFMRHTNRVPPDPRLSLLLLLHFIRKRLYLRRGGELGKAENVGVFRLGLVPRVLPFRCLIHATCSGFLGFYYGVELFCQAIVKSSFGI